jgi:hypothetical protein
MKVKKLNNLNNLNFKMPMLLHRVTSKEQERSQNKHSPKAEP